MTEEITALLDRAWDLLRSGEKDRAEQLFVVVTEKSPRTADGWNGLGAVHFELGDLPNSLANYLKARDVAEVGFGGSFPPKIAWDEEGKPALRAMHGIGLALFRMGRTEEAERVFRELLEYNPNDNQAVRYFLDDISSGSDPWKGNGPNTDTDDDDL